MQNLAQTRAKVDSNTKQSNREALKRFKRAPLPICRIGIDPAFREGGFCVCVIDSESVARFTTFKDVEAFIAWLWTDAPERAIVTVENSNLQNATFDMKGSKATVARKSRNVGANQAVSEITARACIRKYGKENVNNISPREKGRKLTEKEFQSLVMMKKHKLSRYRKSQDARDAYKLSIYGG